MRLALLGCTPRRFTARRLTPYRTFVTNCRLLFSAQALIPRSHHGKDLVQILEIFPRMSCSRLLRMSCLKPPCLSCVCRSENRLRCLFVRIITALSARLWCLCPEIFTAPVFASGQRTFFAIVWRRRTVNLPPIFQSLFWLGCILF